ncbi:MAG: UDP-2,3-diacylglucosamine diphosphatase [Thiohalomonadales bacterium]
MQSYFISDLHLSAQRPHIIELLLDFLASCDDAARLYILGDLFEAWIGDDYADPAMQPVIQALQKFSRNTDCFIMHGNRDFLIGSDFVKQTGFELLPDEIVIDLNGRKTLLLHGDTLCTDDVDYQTIRKQVRTPQWKNQVLALPTQQRLSMAKQFRMDSDQSKSQKSEEIMDVNQQAVIDIMQHHAVNLLIHGHTHRLAIHEFTLDNAPAKRIVLGDWYKTRSVLVCGPTGENFL